MIKIYKVPPLVKRCTSFCARSDSLTDSAAAPWPRADRLLHQLLHGQLEQDGMEASEPFYFLQTSCATVQNPLQGTVDQHLFYFSMVCG